MADRRIGIKKVRGVGHVKDGKSPGGRIGVYGHVDPSGHHYKADPSAARSLRGRGLSEAEIAEQLGVSKSTVSRYLAMKS